MLVVGVYAGVVLIILLVVHSARRFAKRQQRAGRWDEHGPLNPTPAPPLPGNVFALGHDALLRAWERRNGPEGAINIVEDLPPDGVAADEDSARRAELN